MAVVEVFVDDETKRKVDAVLAQTGVTAGTVIGYLYSQIAEGGVVPFEPFEPNDKTVAAMEAADRGELVTVGDINGLFADLNADD
jgi:DNA-damage-inducible protein J